MDELIVACRSCGARNRKALEKLGEQAVCAKCGTSLPRGGGPLRVNAAQFDLALRQSPVPVLVDFWAPWCGPCRVFAPVLERYAAAHPDDLLVLKVDTEAEPALGRRFQITSIPTTALFRGSQEVARQPGAMAEPALEEWVRRARG